jgi:RNA polymerase sigma factor (sigma-70 family)
VSRRTILRDLEALSYAGVPIIAEGGRGGGVRLDEAYQSGLTGLGEGEMRALVLGADAALAKDLGMGESFRLGRLKLQASQARSFDPALERLQRRVLVDSRWWWRDEDADAFLPLLQEAVFGDVAVEAEYEHFDGSRRSGAIEPYGLVAKSGQWYLIGRRDGELRSYRVSRFRSVLSTGEAFERDEGFDLREWWPANEDRFAAEFSAFRCVVALPEESFGIVRRIAPGRATVRGGDPSRPGWIEAEIRVDSSFYAELIVLGLGGECIVVEPDSLADAVAARARAALDGPAIARLFAECLPRVVSFAARMLGDEEAARDVAQDAFAAAIASAGSFRGESAPLTWIMSIAKNLCRKRMRGARELTFGDFEAIIDADSEAPSPGRSGQELGFYAEEVKHGCLVGLLGCLPFAQRCAFVLHLLNDVPVPEVGRILGRSENSVRILLSRARASMKAFLCANCSLMAEGSRCRCVNMVEFSLRRDLIRAYKPGMAVEEIKDELRRFSDEVALYRSLPDPASAVSLAIEGGRYRVFSKK